MSDIPTDLKYNRSHEWAQLNEDGSVTVGITDHAQKLLGDIVFVDLPEVGSELSSQDECGVVESVKAASDLYTPLSGEVVEVNQQLADEPELINQDPYSAGWVLKLKPVDEAELDELLDAEGYATLIESEE